MATGNQQEYSTTLVGSSTHHHQEGRARHKRIFGVELTRADSTEHASRTGKAACPTHSAGSQLAGDGGGSDAADFAIRACTGADRAKAGQVATGLL